jgi:nicotinamide mononucleotide adenylyltransferase
MLEECEQVTVVIGSSQEFGTQKNPFRFRERKEMITNYYNSKNLKNRMKVVGQIDTNDYHGWCHTVLDTIADAYENTTPVDAFYCGLHYDSQWYTPEIKKLEIVSRIDPNFTYVSGTLIREQCMFQDERWRDLVPEVNHSFLETLSKRFLLDSKPR